MASKHTTFVQGRGNLPQLEWVDELSGKVTNYISRTGCHPNTGKPLSDILIVEGGLAINWPKVADPETGEPVPWFYFDGELALGSLVEVAWVEGHFSCTILG